MIDLADATCGAGFAAYVGLEYDRSTLFFMMIYPTQDAWEFGDRRVLCYLGTENFDVVQVGSARGTRR